MSTIRVNKNKNFTVMSNHHLRNRAMSLKTKGLLSMMLDFPDDWDYSVKGLVSICKESKEAIQSALKELETLGYLVRTKSQDERGRFAYIYDVYDVPVSELPENVLRDGAAGKTVKKPVFNDMDDDQPEPVLPQQENPVTDETSESLPRPGKPVTVEPFTGEPCTENQQQLNTNKSNTNKSRTQKDRTQYIYKAEEQNQIVGPSKSEVEEYCTENNIHIDVDLFMAYNNARGWQIGGYPARDWKSLVVLWAENDMARRRKGSLKEKFREIDAWAQMAAGGV